MCKCFTDCNTHKPVLFSININYSTASLVSLCSLIEKYDRHVKRGDSVLWSTLVRLTWSTASSSGVPAQGGRETLRAGPVKGQGNNDQRAEAALLLEQFEKVGWLTMEKRRLQENIIAAFQYLRGIYRNNEYHKAAMHQDCLLVFIFLPLFCKKLTE